MKYPCIPRRYRAAFFEDLAGLRSDDCAAPRDHSFPRRCGRCYACGVQAGVTAMYRRGLH